MVRDVAFVECFGDLSNYLGLNLEVFREYLPIEAIRANTFVKVALVQRIGDLFLIKNDVHSIIFEHSVVECCRAPIHSFVVFDESALNDVLIEYNRSVFLD